MKPIDYREKRVHEIVQIGSATTEQTFSTERNTCKKAARMDTNIRSLKKDHNKWAGPHRWSFRCIPSESRKVTFIEPWCIGFSSLWRSRFVLRLIFDKAPYPPRSEWERPEEGPDSGQFWSHIEFVGRRAPELKKRWGAMNDIPPAGWNTYVVSW
jgi:hypothetical protein